MDKGKAVIDGDIPAVTKPTQKPPTMRGLPICYHYGLSGHIRPKFPLLKARRSKVKKEPTRQATFGTKPPVGYQAPQHQQQQQQFIPANQNGKPKKNKSRCYKKSQKPESDQSYEAAYFDAELVEIDGQPNEGQSTTTTGKAGLDQKGCGHSLL
jgi:hypothetical protein